MPATFHFYLRDDQPNKQGECAIHLRITLDRKLKYHNTGIKILPERWNNEKEKVRRSHRNYKLLNQDLQILKEKAQQAARELERDGKASAEAIKAKLAGASRDNFFTLAGEYVQKLQYEKQYHTHKQAKVSVKKLNRFHGSDDLPLSSVNVRFIEEFQSYLKYEYGNKASTIRKNLGAISGILDIAVRDHLLNENPFKNDSFTFLKNEPTAYKAKIPFDQIQELKNIPLQKRSNNWHARNCFVLAFYFCGMRFGDLATLTWQNVEGGRLRYTMNKTGKPIDIELPGGAIELLDYYDHPGKELDDYILPRLNRLPKQYRDDALVVRKRVSSANAMVNTCLKKVAKKVGIKENLSMHVARHSFAQYAADVKEIPAYKLMMLLGHSSIDTTQHYLKK